MSDIERDIRDLREKTNQSRHQFLSAEMKTCFIAIERAQPELSLGNAHEARKEFLLASRGAEVIERFLREAEGGNVRHQV